MYGRMKGRSGEGGAFSPKALSYRRPFSTETGVVQWGPKLRPQIRIPSPGSGGLSSPGSTRNQGPRNSDTKSRGPGSQLARAAKSQCHCCCRCGFSSLGMIYASGWTFFFSLSPSLLFWILLWNFFLLGLFLGQCSPDIWFTVNSIDCIGLSQEMEEIAFSFFFFFLSAGWQLSLSPGLAKLCECT